MPKLILSNYPHLHNLLRNDPRANTDFNAIISSLTAAGAGQEREKEYEANLEAERIRATESEERAKKAEALNLKSLKFVRIVGETIESQLSLNPYVTDVAEKATYEIKFNAVQVRMAVRWYWEVIGGNMEQALLSRSTPDPIDEEST